MEQSNIIKNAYIEISRALQTPDPELWSPEYQFATLTIEIEDVPPISEEQHVIFNIDISGSMSDVCSDGRSKMQHIAHTTKNIMDVFSSEKNANITVEIYGFDDKLEQILPPTKCCDASRDLIHAAIVSKLRPRNTTDILIALKNAKERLERVTTRKTHVFMTDGQITSGDKNIEVLESFINGNYPNVFVGFGTDHDAYLLQILAKRGSYYYIDHVETAGLAYGEITHAIMYQALENITMTVSDGEIYDYRTNTWSDTLQLESLVGEAKKTFHLRSKTPAALKATICATDVLKREIKEEVDILPELLGGEPNNFTNYMYRQRTLELIYDANSLQKIEQKNLRDSVFRSQVSFGPILEKMSNFLKGMKDYIQNNNLSDDDFMKSLCDDISVTYDSLRQCGSNIGIAYSAGRARSNGAQGCYQPVFRRMNAETDFTFMDGNTSARCASLNRTNTSGRQMTMMQTVSQEDNDLELSRIDTIDLELSQINHPTLARS